MRDSGRAGLASVLVAVAAVCAACGSSAAPTATPAIAPSASAPVAALAYSEASAGATWAVLPMGAPSGPNEFWQLFRLASGQAAWVLDTPPDIATNGAIELAGLAGPSVVTGVRPSLYLSFSPVSLSSDGGRQWTAGPPARGLADVPDALAATAGGTHLLALSTSGQVTTATASASAWTPVTTQRSLAATPAGRACRLTRLTAVGYAADGVVMAGGTCAAPGVAGLFSQEDGTWHAVRLPVPAALGGARLQVLGLDTTAAGPTALLEAGSGTTAQLLAAWLRNGTWNTSAAASLAGASLSSTAFGASGAVGAVLSDGHAVLLSGPGGAWARTPLVPAGRAVTIAFPARGHAEALAAAAGTVTVWQLAAAPSRWVSVQTVKVPIQYGSSS